MNGIPPCSLCGCYCTEHGRWEEVGPDEPEQEILCAAYVWLPAVQNPESILSARSLLDAAHGYAMAYGLRVTHEFVDYGNPKGDRPAWSALLKEAKRVGAFQCVLIAGASQLPHHLDIDARATHGFADHSVPVRSMNVGPYRSPTAILAEKVLSAFNQRRRERRATRQRQLRDMRAAQKAKNRSARRYGGRQ